MKKTSVTSYSSFQSEKKDKNVFNPKGTTGFTFGRKTSQVSNIQGTDVLNRPPKQTDREIEIPEKKPVHIARGSTIREQGKKLRRSSIGALKVVKQKVGYLRAKSAQRDWAWTGKHRDSQYEPSVIEVDESLPKVPPRPATKYYDGDRVSLVLETFSILTEQEQTEVLDKLQKMRIMSESVFKQKKKNTIISGEVLKEPKESYVSDNKSNLGPGPVLPVESDDSDVDLEEYYKQKEEEKKKTLAKKVVQKKKKREEKELLKMLAPTEAFTSKRNLGNRTRRKVKTYSTTRSDISVNSKHVFINAPSPEPASVSVPAPKTRWLEQEATNQPDTEL
eukprot:augustus_masked-scaffold_25-processed-gene-5.39-mRNA-1 protein AED:1.00 eAED:1.00 QI:0/-1/0/0/-1/1/1/0/333